MNPGNYGTRGVDTDRGAARSLSPGERVTDLVDSVKTYAIQETVGPARGAARWLAYGTAGAVFLGLGTVFLALGALRLIQDLGGTALGGGWSFVPHLLTAVVLACASTAAIRRVGRSSLARDNARRPA
ncbi:MAG: hypothetical protein RLZZ305_1053 [Actinomycetota bacterium]|jgi:hypothetical protein